MVLMSSVAASSAVAAPVEPPIAATDSDMEKAVEEIEGIGYGKLTEKGNAEIL